MNAKELANEITNFLNTFGDDRAEQLVKALRREHRTLQQKTVKTALMLIESYADTPDRELDARNEGCKEVANNVISGFQKEISEKHNYECVTKPSQHLGSI